MVSQKTTAVHVHGEGAGVLMLLVRFSIGMKVKIERSIGLWGVPLKPTAIRKIKLHL